MAVILTTVGRSSIYAALAEAGPGAAFGKTVVIDFDGLTGDNGSAFAGYEEQDFKVVPSRASRWLVGQDYGAPAPYIFFEPPSTASNVRSTVRIAKKGATFSMTSVDVYSSTTPIPYVFRGLLKGTLVYVVRGQVPNTFGNFATVDNPRTDVIDKLEISLTDPDGNNPMGLDNIRLSLTPASN